jgi:DNA-binding LacI/PurR family transcriptional regulator
MYWRGAEATALQSGYHLDEFKVSGGVSLPRLEKIITARGIRGILLPPHPFRMDWAVFNWGRFSVVRFGRSIESLPFHLVTADHVANTILAFNAIRARGCQRIGMALQQNRRHLLLDAGFLKAQLDVPEKQRLPMCLLDESADMQPQFERWLKKHRPDAVFTEMPQIRDMLGRAGLRVPEDIGMAANSVLDGHADAGIDQNPEEIGRVAMLLLISLMHDNDRGIPPIPHELLVKGKWVDGSTLPPRL